MLSEEERELAIRLAGELPDSLFGKSVEYFQELERVLTQLEKATGKENE